MGRDAKVVIPTEKETTDVTVQEGEHVVWEKGHYLGVDPGIDSASQRDNSGRRVT